jgi:hypothetical protein
MSTKGLILFSQQFHFSFKLSFFHFFFFVCLKLSFLLQFVNKYNLTKFLYDSLPAHISYFLNYT